MKYLLDTNAWISVLKKSSSPVKNRLAKHSPLEIVTCSVVKSELYYGAYKSTRSAANLELLDNLFKQFASFTFNLNSAVETYCERLLH